MDLFDVEEVLRTAIHFAGLKTKKPLSTTDIYDLAFNVWKNECFQTYLEIKESYKKETYHLSRSEVEDILIYGNLEIRYQNDKTVKFVLKEDAADKKSREEFKEVKKLFTSFLPPIISLV